MTDKEIIVRAGRPEDREAVVAFTDDTWTHVDDYVPDAFDGWVETDGPTQRTLVAVVDGRPIGLCQGVRLTAHEAWAQGMRVDPAFRDGDVGRRLAEAIFEWAAERGATVCRNMVFSWNAAGLGQSRGLGFEPIAAFRWLEPTPDEGATPALDVSSAPAVAWSGFHGSDAYRELCGLGLDLEESWSLAEVTRARLEAAEETLAVRDDDRIRGMSYRTRTDERETEDGTRQLAEYGVGAWDDVEALRSLAAAVARDAAEQGADRARVLVPETPRHVSDAAYVRVATADEPDFVLERDLIGYR